MDCLSSENKPLSRWTIYRSGMIKLYTTCNVQGNGASSPSNHTINNYINFQHRQVNLREQHIMLNWQVNKGSETKVFDLLTHETKWMNSNEALTWLMGYSLAFQTIKNI